MCIIYKNTEYFGYDYFHLRFDEVENGMHLKNWRYKYKIVGMHPFKIYSHENFSVDKVCQ